jgi:uncharacterized membrane protein HdeD (DUF308 family)
MASPAGISRLIGIWFIVMGVFEIIGAFMLRHVAKATRKNLAPA